MTAFQVPELSRFEFTVPGSKTKYSLPMIVDLEPDTLRALQAAGENPSDDPQVLKELVASVPDDDATRLAVGKLAMSQIVALVQAWGDSSRLSLGESSAS